MLAHVAGMPLEEWLMPFIVSAGGVLVGIRAMCSSRISNGRSDRHVDRLNER
jgi:hypothetical protein